MIQLSEERKELCELRRCRKALDMFGKGIIIFAIWATVRNSMYIFLNDESISVLSSEIEQTGMDTTAYMLLFYSIVFIDLIIRFFTAKAVIKDAKGKKKHKARFYIVVCVCMILVTIYGTFLGFSGESLYGGWFNRLVTFMLDLADVYTIVSVIHYSNKIKRLNKILSEGVN